MKRLILAFGIFTLLTGRGFAQAEVNSWENLARLGSGERIEVVDMKLKSFRGTFVSFSPEAISLRVRSNEVTVQRADVLRVSSRERTRRGKSVLVGLAVGVVVGAALGAAAIASGGYGAEGAISFPIGFGLIGACIGAAFPGYQTIYRAGKKTAATH